MEALTTQRDTELVTSAWGTENTSSKDLVIPKIQIAQANSNACKEGNARPGDLVHSLTKEVLASKGQKLAILPILSIATWIITTPKPPGGGFPTFIGKQVLTPENDSDAWKVDCFENNEPAVRNKCLTYLVLLLERKNGFPFFIDFQNTNKAAGKNLSTIIQENKFQNLPAPARVVEMSTTLKNYKSNSWFVVNVAPQRQSSADEIALCKKWYDLFSTVQFKEAEEEEDNGIS